MSLRYKGFTLIELLTVIAIISILAAIIFPVYARAKDSAYRGSDISNMNALRTALQLYKADQGDFPPALLGYVTLYTTGPNMGDVIPAEQLVGALYPKRVESLNVFRPSYDRESGRSISGLSGITAAVWPNQDPRALGSAPIVDTNGDGTINAADDQDPCARQAYGPTTQVLRPDPANPGSFIPAQYYRISGYDLAPDRDQSNGNNILAIRYTRFWTGFGIGTGGACGSGGSIEDDPRQLGYNDPPETTLITWNSWFRDEFGPGGVPSLTKRDVALFLGGNARTYSSRELFERSWRAMP